MRSVVQEFQSVRIRDCLKSALSQEYSNFDVIAIDDRSTDETGAVMGEVAAQPTTLPTTMPTTVPSTRPSLNAVN